MINKKVSSQVWAESIQLLDSCLHILVFILPRPSYRNSSRPTRVVIRYMRGTSSDPWPPIHFISPWHSLVFRYKTSYDVAHHWGVPF